MRHLHAAMLCGVFRVSVYDVDINENAEIFSKR